MDVVWSSTVIAAVVAGIFSYFLYRRRDKLRYITAERRQWRKEIRKIASKIHKASHDEIFDILVDLKVRINAYGQRGGNVYDKDAHIWELINTIEKNDCSKQVYENQKKLLIEYLSLLLKFDWEKSKNEIIGDWSKILGYIVMAFSCIGYVLIFLNMGIVQDVESVTKSLLYFTVVLFILGIYGLFIIQIDDLINFGLLGYIRLQKADNIMTVVICEMLALIAIIGYVILSAVLLRNFVNEFGSNQKDCNYAIFIFIIVGLQLIGGAMSCLSSFLEASRKLRYYSEIMYCKNNSDKQIGEYSKVSKSKGKVNKNKVWDRTNVILAGLGIILTIVGVCLYIKAFYSKSDADVFSLYMGLCGIIAGFVSAIMITGALRINDMYKEEHKKERAKVILLPMIVEVYTVIDSIMPEINKFVKISEDDIIDCPNNTVYYTDDNSSNGNRCFINFEKEFKCFNNRLEYAMDKCLNSPMLLSCDIEVIELLTEMRQNDFPRCLRDFYVNKSLGIKTYGCYKKYKEFNVLYGRLALMVDKKNNKQPVELNEEQRNQYIEIINAIRPQLPAKAGKVIHNGMRIK